jgi:UDP-N-acetylmuramate dehydrogenase
VLKPSTINHFKYVFYTTIRQLDKFEEVEDEGTLMRIAENIDLMPYNSYKISTKAAIAYFPESIEDFEQLYCQQPQNNYFIIGGGNNIILGAKKYEKKKFIIIKDNFSHCKVENNIIEAYSGTTLKTLSEIALSSGLSGLEIFYDIPGTLGGAIWMNAGAYGESFMDLVKEVTVLNRTTKSLDTISSDNIICGYRYSQFQDNNTVILSAKLSLKQGNKEEIEEKMMNTYNLRNEKFPKEFPNAGSVFKRPPDGYPVGMMVEQLGLKGFSIGGAKISEKHGGFIVNYNNATAEDIISLTDLIKTKVREKYGFELFLEQIVIFD